MSQSAQVEISKTATATHSSAVAGNTLMAFTAGFVDTASFVALFGLFAAHVTGNFVLIGASLANSRPGIFGKLLAFPVFLIAVALTRLFLHRCERRQADATAPLLIGEIFFLLLFLGVGVLASPIADADAPLALLAGMLGVTAMAIQNAAARSVFAENAPTTVMTGNVTQIMMDLVDLALGAATVPARARMRKMIPAVLGFTLGAIGGGVGLVWLGFWCIACPILAMLIVLLAHERAQLSGRVQT